MEKNNVHDFWDKYALLANTNEIHQTLPKQRICRFCKRTGDETTFKQKTHLIPELLGQNKILTFDECDRCNNIFSDYESHLALYLRPYLTLTGIRGKKKIPTFQSRSEDENSESRTILKHTNEGERAFQINHASDYTVNLENKTATIVFRKSPFVPLKIYKALLKIGLALLPQEHINNNSNAFQLLLGNNNVPFVTTGFSTNLQRVYFRTPMAHLYMAKNISAGNHEFPDYTLIVGCANHIFQIFLPFTDSFLRSHNPHTTLSLSAFPAFLYDKVKEINGVVVNTIDLSIDEPVTQDHEFYFSFTNLNRTVQTQ